LTLLFSFSQILIQILSREIKQFFEIGNQNIFTTLKNNVLQTPLTWLPTLKLLIDWLSSHQELWNFLFNETLSIKIIATDKVSFFFFFSIISIFQKIK